MGDYTRLILFLWIVGAPTFGFIVLSRSAFQRSYWDSSRARATAGPEDAVV